MLKTKISTLINSYRNTDKDRKLKIKIMKKMKKWKTKKETSCIR